MQCIAHIWKSFDCEGKHFLLRLRPLYSLEHHRSVESFRNERSLSRRLAGIGFTKLSIRTSLTNLRTGENAMWSHMEIAQDIFDGFGESGEPNPDRLLAHPILAF